MSLKLGITMLIHNEDDIEFVTEFPCLLGHPVDTMGHAKLWNCKTTFKQSYVYFMLFLQQMSYTSSLNINLLSEMGLCVHNVYSKS